MPTPLPDGSGALVLLHNPRCSKSRAALALLEERGVEVTLRLYLEEPLSAAELGVLRARLGRPVREWVRPKEAEFADSGASLDDGDDALIAAVAAHPKLLERPILVGAERAAVGRPPEDVLALLD